MAASLAEAAAASQARKVAHVEKFVDRFRYKAAKARQVQSRIKTLEKLEQIEVPEIEELKLKFSFPEPRRSARVVIEIDGADIGYGDDTPVVSNANLVVERGDKLALIGPNGAGKSTLLNLIAGLLFELQLYTADPGGVKENDEDSSADGTLVDS